jgi:hypothetical protein
MNLSQAKTQLEKIIALYKSMSADEKNISAIERDLMLSYIRGLYENFLDTTTPVQTASSHSSNDSRSAVAPKPVVEAPPPPVVVEQPKPTPPPVVEQPRYVPPPVVEQPKYVAPPVVEKPHIETPPPPVVVERPKPTPPPAPEPVRYQAPTPSVPSNVSPEIQALFEETAGNELSDRLANTPINDLTKAFGLNDRLLMQNELFANNKAVFDEIVKDLNNASSFNSAQGYLVDFAKRYNWTANPERQKHAKSFIKMVRRRFK